MHIFPMHFITIIVLIYTYTIEYSYNILNFDK
jgi:hypothetical protein